MYTNELFLKTLFCCSACDGDIAKEEVDLVKQLANNANLFSSLPIEETLNSYIAAINKHGKLFLRDYINEIIEANLSDKDQITLIDLAIKMIEADNVIQYSEVKFFKKIRNCLSISDDAILEQLPNCEDYLLPDISVESKDFEDVGYFAPISFTNL